MQTNRILLAFVAVAALVAMVAFPSTSGVIAQTYDTQKKESKLVSLRMARILKTFH